MRRVESVETACLGGICLQSLAASVVGLGFQSHPGVRSEKRRLSTGEGHLLSDVDTRV